MSSKKHSRANEHKGIRWEVDPQGGYIRYAQGTEGDLLYRDRMIAGKRRGGLFACIPQFGPDRTVPESSALPQHGFGRTSLWSIGRISAGGVALHHARVEGAYEGLHSSLIYDFNRANNGNPSISATLTVFNESDSSMRIAPGLHPCIDLSWLDSRLRVDMQRNLSIAQTVPANMASLAVSDSVEVVVETTGFQRLTWWTDALGKYICVEPSLAGPSFETDPAKPLDTEMLEPGDVREFGMTITWRPITTNADSRGKSRIRS